MARSRSVPLLALLLLLPASVTTAATGSKELARISDEYWQGYLLANPTSATSLGDKRYDDRLDDNTPEGIMAETRRLEGVRAVVSAIAPEPLSASDRITRAALLSAVDEQLGWLACGFHTWVVDPLNGPQVSFMNLPDYTRIDTPRDAKAYVTRVQAMGPYVDNHVKNLRTGLGQGKTATRDAVQKSIDQLERLAGSPVESLAVYGPALAKRTGWSQADRDRFGRDLREALSKSLMPAYARYHEFLKTEILPAARPPEKAGLLSLPGGLECYGRMIHVHTSLDRSAEEIHKLGLEQVAVFRRDLAALGQKALGTSDVAEIQRRLRTSPDMHFRTGDEIEGKAREALARARAKVPAWFGRIQPKAACEVRVMGMHEAPYSTVAYYRQPSSDGKRPGRYMINTYLPETRPRYEAEALAFHEAVPGHHLQIAVAQELTGVPEFRKHQGVTAFVEGWALYTERLSDEMGLYSSDVDRMGMLSYDAWRACRLVVDTGLHAMGWSRQQAIDYMKENSVLAENNIVNEVDRYLTWPGQALAYKLGQLEILRLREEARTRLGERFDIKAFHDAVLGNGAVALPALREQVEAYIQSAAAPN
ncbi:MAG TPA: DUF885 domain-containing protein [Candidatus Eisenbacteria bacterium]|nr:DUF885 domain-containing protein [Candidatus Eisenbacteria bacterium]